MSGRDIYLGGHGTPESRAAYDRVVAEWLANGRRLVEESPVTIAELVVAYLRHVDGRYESEEPANIRYALRPVRDEHVDAVLPFLTKPVRAMVILQRLTAARPGEICIMRTCDLDTTGDVWAYRPAQHKTIHLDRDRVIFLGPAAQDLLRPFLRIVETEYLFQPREADAERLAALRAARKSKVQPSQVDRSKPNPVRKPGEKYDNNGYRRAVTRGIEKANQALRSKDPEAKPIPHWHPHQLRHSAATNLRRTFDLDVARAVLGHSSSDVTERYALIDEEKARQAMERMG